MVTGDHFSHMKDIFVSDQSMSAFKCKFADKLTLSLYIVPSAVPDPRLSQLQNSEHPLKSTFYENLQAKLILTIWNQQRQVVSRFKIYSKQYKICAFIVER